MPRPLLILQNLLTICSANTFNATAHMYIERPILPSTGVPPKRKFSRWRNLSNSTVHNRMRRWVGIRAWREFSQNETAKRYTYREKFHGTYPQWLAALCEFSRNVTVKSVYDLVVHHGRSGLAEMVCDWNYRTPMHRCFNTWFIALQHTNTSTRIFMPLLCAVFRLVAEIISTPMAVIRQIQ